jgi:regulator of cell morphogenesis and NO signaling
MFEYSGSIGRGGVPAYDARHMANTPALLSSDVRGGPMQITGQSMIGELVAEDFRAAGVFQEYGIDFCCGGKRSVTEACRERGVDPGAVVATLTSACAQPDSSAPRFSEWEPETLIGFIVGNHHGYVRRALPLLTAHTKKLAAVHGSRHPELHEVAQLTQTVADEMTSHMAKEERILFPYIALLAEAVRDGQPAPPTPFGNVDHPIRMMEEEHESAGAAMARIRELTGGYAVPQDGCTTYRVCLQELDAFERDLHAHVHLENNLLFPKTRALAARGPV